MADNFCLSYTKIGTPTRSASPVKRNAFEPHISLERICAVFRSLWKGNESTRQEIPWKDHERVELTIRGLITSREDAEHGNEERHLFPLERYFFFLYHPLCNDLPKGVSIIQIGKLHRSVLAVTCHSATDYNSRPSSTVGRRH